MLAISFHCIWISVISSLNQSVNIWTFWSLMNIPFLIYEWILRTFRICRVQFWFGQRINECQIEISNFIGRVAHHKGVENGEACSFERFQLLQNEIKSEHSLIFNFNYQSTLNLKPWIFHQTDFGIFHCLIHYFWVRESDFICLMTRYWVRMVNNFIDEITGGTSKLNSLPPSLRDLGAFNGCVQEVSQHKHNIQGDVNIDFLIILFSF